MRLKQWKARDFYCYKVVNKTEHLDFRQKKKKQQNPGASIILIPSWIDIVSFSISRPL